MIRATVARGLRLLASLVDGGDPAALALSEALRAQGDARRALEAAERTRGVVAAMLREGVNEVERVVAATNAAFYESRPEDAGPRPMPALTVRRAREALRDLAGEG